jgi:hypothetical protein
LSPLLFLAASFFFFLFLSNFVRRRRRRRQRSAAPLDYLNDLNKIVLKISLSPHTNQINLAA